MTVSLKTLSLKTLSLKTRCKTQNGFTLLEVVIALSILVLALSILIENQGFGAAMTREADKIRLATMLAEEKIVEAQLHLELDGWTTSDIDEDGDFDDFGSEEFRGGGIKLDWDEDLDDFKWAYTIRKIEMNLPADMGGALTELMGETSGDQSKMEDIQNNQLSIGDFISPDMISDMLSDYVREVRVMVWWNEDWEETGDYVEILTHVVNPSGIVTDPEAETQ